VRQNSAASSPSTSLFESASSRTPSLSYNLGTCFQDNVIGVSMEFIFHRSSGCRQQRRNLIGCFSCHWCYSWSMLLPLAVTQFNVPIAPRRCNRVAEHLVSKPATKRLPKTLTSQRSWPCGRILRPELLAERKLRPPLVAARKRAPPKSLSFGSLLLWFIVLFPQDEEREEARSGGCSCSVARCSRQHDCGRKQQNDTVAAGS
jgi:hypothetical protein